MRSLTKRQKDLTVLVLAVVFLLAAAAYSWFRLYAPARDANARAASSVAEQREVLFELQRQLAAKPEEAASGSQPLQRKIPVAPLEELLVFQLEKAEVKSGVNIRDVQFTKDDPAMETPESETAGAAEDPSAETALRRVTVAVDLTADTYAAVDRFIREVERTERIFIVQAIELTPPGELRERETESEPLGMTISFQAFYRPDLPELLPEVPKLDAPVSAGKDDPTVRADEEDVE